MITSFDLNSAIQRWRHALAQSPAFSNENLEELESHLRDAIAGLQTRGLSAEEAFFVAAKRVGRSTSLETEFAKINAPALWRDRALWMLAGMLFLTVGWDLTRAVSSALTFVGTTFSSNGLALGWLNVASKFTMLGLISAAFWRLANGRLEHPRFGASRISRRPVLFTLVALGAVAVLKFVCLAFELLWFRNLPTPSLAQTYLVAQWFAQTGPIIAAGLMIVLFVRLWRGRAILQAGGRAAACALMVPLAFALTLSPAHAQTNTVPSPSAASDQQASATVDQAMTLWRAGKKDEATAKFLAVDFSKRPLFPSSSVLNYTEAQFMALPEAPRTKLAKQMNDDLQTIKQLAVYVKGTGQTAKTAGDQAKSDLCMDQLHRCGVAFDQPDSLAMLKLVGKALQKMASPSSSAPAK